MYHRDPDGVQVELQIDSFATRAELEGRMRGGTFEAG
jgi:hypothetical protein